MKTNNESFKTVAKRFCILLICWLAFVLFIVIRNVFTDDSLEKNYFSKINFNFTGVVFSEFRYNGDFGGSGLKLQPSKGTKFNIFYLKTIKSSIEDYDARDTCLEFYCIIKKKGICIIENTERENIVGGDIIKFDGIKDSTYHYKIVHKRKNKNYYTDTILYAKWRPTNIFREPNRKRLVIEVLRKNAPF